MIKPVLESWKNKIDVVESVRGGMTNEARNTLARVLNNTNKAIEDLRTIKNEGLDSTPASNMSGIDWFPPHSIDMVSTIYASQIIDDIVSVQSIDSPIGVIRFLQYVYGQKRGTASPEEVAIDEWGAMRGAFNGKYVASERISGEILGTAVDSSGSAVVHGYAQSLPVKLDAFNHLDITNVTQNKVIRFKRQPGGGFAAVKVSNEGYEESVAGIELHVDEQSGEISVKDASAGLVAAGDSCTMTYSQDLSQAPTDSMNLEVRVRTEMIQAVPHKIRANFAFDASYALSKAHGINIEESLVNACTAEIRQERDNEVINILMRQAGNKSSWSRKITSYISQRDHDLSFLAELFACASKINFETKRGFGNWVVVGRQGLNIIKASGSDHFKSAGATLPNNGAFVAGELEGQIKVIYSPYIPENKYLVGYKGSDMDAGFVVADFLPITKTDLVMLDDFVGRQGLVSYYGTKMINPKMYVVGEILDGDSINVHM